MGSVSAAILTMNLDASARSCYSELHKQHSKVKEISAHMINMYNRRGATIRDLSKTKAKKVCLGKNPYDRLDLRPYPIDMRQQEAPGDGNNPPRPAGASSAYFRSCFWCGSASQPTSTHREENRLQEAQRLSSRTCCAKSPNHGLSTSSSGFRP